MRSMSRRLDDGQHGRVPAGIVDGTSLQSGVDLRDLPPRSFLGDAQVLILGGGPFAAQPASRATPDTK